MPLNFRDHPGQLFVVATLLPLAAFLLILLAGAVWAALRPYQRNSSVRPLYDLFGGEDEDRPGRGRLSAYTATCAIGIAFLFCAAGAVQYFSSLGPDEDAKHSAEREIDEAREKLPAALERNRAAQDQLALLKRQEPKPAAAEVRKAEADVRATEEQVTELIDSRDAATSTVAKLDTKWDGHFDWLRIFPGTAVDGASATALRLGFHIDALSVVMFLMVTFVATLIHLFSIGYMSGRIAADGRGPPGPRRPRPFPAPRPFRSILPLPVALLLLDAQPSPGGQPLPGVPRAGSWSASARIC